MTNHYSISLKMCWKLINVFFFFDYVTKRKKSKDENDRLRIFNRIKNFMNDILQIEIWKQKECNAKRWILRWWAQASVVRYGISVHLHLSFCSFLIFKNLFSKVFHQNSILNTKLIMMMVMIHYIVQMRTNRKKERATTTWRFNYLVWQSSKWFQNNTLCLEFWLFL